MPAVLQKAGGSVTAGPSCFLLLCPQTLPWPLWLVLSSVEHRDIPFQLQACPQGMSAAGLFFAFSPVIPFSFFQHQRDL